jgi:hypothetical protein
MKNIEIFIQNVPTNVPTLITIKVHHKNYSAVKLYIPKVNGKPTILPNKRWYVYYYFRNPETNKMQKFIFHYGINKLKTITERKEYGNAWVKAITILLEQALEDKNKIIAALEEKIGLNKKYAG